MPKKSLGSRLWHQRYLLLMSLPFVVWVIAFAYLPLFGWVMAFQNFKLGRESLLQTFFTAPWVGLEHFELLWEELTNRGRFYFAFRNTLVMGILTITIGFIMPIIFAVFLNELRSLRFKRITQTVSYLPHFVSWVVVAGMVYEMLASSGPVNDLLINLGLADRRVAFMGQPQMFWGIFITTDIWKNLGWNAIIFLAAISGVDPGLYESAVIDGAGRFRKIWNITIPCIMPVIVVILIMNVGWVISVGFERQMLLGNAQVMETADVIDWYSLRLGIGRMRFSFATAIGMARSIVSIILVLGANAVARKFGDSSIM